MQCCVSRHYGHLRDGRRDPSATITAVEARAVKRGLSYLKKASLKWMDGRGCVSRHQVPTMIWSQEAVPGKDDPQRTELNQWIDWSGKVMNFVKPHQKANVDANATMAGKRIVLPAILSKAVLQMNTGEITLALVDDAAEIVGKAVEHQTA